MRNIDEVLDAMLAAVPTEAAALRADLERLKRDVRYIPPEAHRVAWKRGAELLYQTFGDEPPTEGWQGRVFRIWMGEVEEARTY